MIKLIIVQTIIPDYRRNLFMYLKKDLNDFFDLFGGQSYFEKTVNSDSNTYYNKVKNFYFLNRKLLFQYGFWSVVTQNNVMVLELNPRIISNWIILFVRKLFNKKTILWGHAWPRSGSESKTDIIRNVMRTLADVIIVYTVTQKEGLQKKMPKAKILYAPNSLYFKSQMSANIVSSSIKNVIYVGRLTRQKKAFLLVKAFHAVIDKIPRSAKLIVVGEGEEKKLILDYVNENKLGEKINILGHVGDYSVLKNLYDTSLFSVSSGYVGLSITQSFSFGVPMLISREEPHSPEIEAAIENYNAVFFEKDSIDGLGAEIIKFYQQKEDWVSKRIKIMEFCKNSYSIEAMSNTFKTLIS